MEIACMGGSRGGSSEQNDQIDGVGVWPNASRLWMWWVVESRSRSRSMMNPHNTKLTAYPKG